MPTDRVEGVVCCEIEFTDRGWCFFIWDEKCVAERRHGKWYSLDPAYTVTGDLDHIEVQQNGVLIFGNF
jgi:hypothetical protein